MKLPWPELKLPAYKTGKHGPWTLSDTTGAMPGYFTPYVKERTVPALRRKEYNKDIVWMSLTQMEQESHMPHIMAAHGHTVVMGLGMGMYLYNIIQKKNVERVTVIEKDKRVYELLKRITDIDQWPGIEKVKFVTCDARCWFTLEDVDFLYADFWKRMSDRNAAKWTAEVVDNVKPRMFGYWTQEMDFVHYLSSKKIKIDDADLFHFDMFAKSIAGENLSHMVGQGDRQYLLLCCICIMIQIATGCAVQGDMYAATMINSRLADCIAYYEETYDGEMRRVRIKGAPILE
jgi:hypothetical protein